MNNLKKGEKMTAFEQLYSGIMDKISIIQKQTSEYDVNNIQAKSYSFHGDFAFWIDLLRDSGRKEVVLLENALREFLISQIMLTQGFYKHSFMCLRGFLEQTLFAIQLSTNELHMRQWFTNQKDVYWSAIIEADNGLFSKTYIDAFYPTISDNTKEFLVMSKKVYRECSEFVHGNYSVNEHTLNLEFREKTFLLWHEKVDTIQLIITFCLFVRYNEFINTKELINQSEPIISDRIGYIEAVREFYNR